LEAADNYVAIHYKDGQGMAKKLIRSSLSRIEHELESFPYFMRCHRSFLINLDQVKWIKGNSKKPEVHLRGVDAPIPVARKKAAILNEQLQRLSP
jgi:DNA-binding LytR/AlgR family response regulator